MSDLHVLFKLGESEYAVASEEIFQMESYSGVTPVPGAPAYVAGLVQIRQQIVPLLDLRLRFGLASVAPTLESRIIVLKNQDRLVGLLVDSAREVQKMSMEQFQAPPDMISRQAAGFVKAVVQLNSQLNHQSNKRIIMVLDSEKVVGEESLHG